MVNAKQKGSRGERELAEWLRENGCASARRTQQYCGTEGTSDITVKELSDWHIEHKATKNAKIPPSMLKSWFKQVRTDCPADKLPVIINTPNGRERVAILPLRTVETLRATVGVFSNVQLLYVDTALGNAQDFEYLLNKILDEWVCRNTVQDMFAANTPWLGLVGGIPLGEETEYYMMFKASIWLHFAKELQALTSGLVDTSSLQEQGFGQGSPECQKSELSEQLP